MCLVMEHLCIGILVFHHISLHLGIMCPSKLASVDITQFSSNLMLTLSKRFNDIYNGVTFNTYKLNIAVLDDSAGACKELSIVAPICKC